ncbi:MAG: hypothetical protein ABDH49_04115 [Candidatus Hydrothermales bacterium]
MYLIIIAAEEYKIHKNKVIINKSDTLIGDISVIGRDVEVRGGIKGDLAVIGGNLKVDGFVQGNAVVIGGDCRVSGQSLYRRGCKS